MSDDPKKRAAETEAGPTPTKTYEMRYWSKKFGVSPDQLKAVKKVGNSVATVQQELSHS